MKSDNVQGGYAYLPGAAVYCRGALADSKFEIKRVQFRSRHGLEDGFAEVERHLMRAGRPMQALCGVELRSPAALTPDAFDAFNRMYIDILDGYHLMLDGMSPIARTNVVPILDPPDACYVHAFSYTVDRESDLENYVISGAAEGDVGRTWDVVADADGEEASRQTSEKVSAVIGEMRSRAALLGARRGADLVHIYSPLPLGYDDRESLRQLAIEAEGVVDCFARPPVDDVLFEMDMSRTSQRGYL